MVEFNCYNDQDEEINSSNLKPKKNMKNMFLTYIENITQWHKHKKFIIQRKTFFTSEYLSTGEQTSEIFFPQEDKLYMLKPTCNFVFITCR